MQNISSSPRRLFTRWPLIATVATIIALIVAAVLLVTTLPPRSVVMATGPEDSTYHAIGKRYRDFFARHRVNLELRPTNGTVDNVELLSDPNSGVSVALIQGGTTDSTRVPDLESLGSLFYEPFWLAAFTSRLLVLLIPIIGVAYPLFRLLPALFGWSMRHRVYRLYGELKFLEAAFDAAQPGDKAALFEQFDRLEGRANRMRVPSAYAQMLYTLKLHIDLVRQHEQNPRQEQQVSEPLSDRHG